MTASENAEKSDTGPDGLDGTLLDRYQPIYDVALTEHLVVDAGASTA